MKEDRIKMATKAKPAKGDKAARSKGPAGKPDRRLARAKAVGDGKARVEAPKASVPALAGATKLTPKVLAFVREYPVDLNATAAAIRAGYSAASAHTEGFRLLRKAEVAASIKAAMDERAKRTEVKADDVVAMFRDIAFADPRELVELRRNCCRYCWGKGFRFQRTDVEMAHAKAEHEKARVADHGMGEFDEQGGVGFHRHRLPNPECAECFGDGDMEVFFHDVRSVSPPAARLYAGVKVTKQGVEVLMHNQADAAIQLGRHLGIFNDKLKLSGKVEHDATEELRQFLLGRDSRLPIRSD